MKKDSARASPSGGTERCPSQPDADGQKQLDVSLPTGSGLRKRFLNSAQVQEPNCQNIAAAIEEKQQHVDEIIIVLDKAADDGQPSPISSKKKDPARVSSQSAGSERSRPQSDAAAVGLVAPHWNRSPKSSLEVSRSTGVDSGFAMEPLPYNSFFSDAYVKKMTALETPDRAIVIADPV
ncbi:hypothetical protein BJ741DRAFT_711605 [Chytriomyces cf. hyalinus JEL632]|nr:hypothetical protein BJ741DRAFT_711605 [Chytriomyces cf. hyalinus JEL632]